MFATNLRRIWRERLAERTFFADPASWWLSLYDRALTRWPRLWLPFRRCVYHVRLSGEPGPFALRLGTTDGRTLHEIFVAGEYSFLKQTSGFGPVRHIVDLGANVGLSVRLWYRLFPGVRVIAVEPDGDNARLCRLNLSLTDGHGASATLLEACLLARHRPVYLAREHGEWGIAARDWDQTAEGPLPMGDGAPAVWTMPELLAAHLDGAPVDLLKCDVEGAEAEIFADCAGWIGAVRHAVVEVHAPYGVAALQADLVRNGVAFQTLLARDNGSQGLLIFRVESLPPLP